MRGQTRSSMAQVLCRVIEASKVIATLFGRTCGPFKKVRLVPLKVWDPIRISSLQKMKLFRCCMISEGDDISLNVSSNPTALNSLQPQQHSTLISNKIHYLTLINLEITLRVWFDLIECPSNSVSQPRQFLDSTPPPRHQLWFCHTVDRKVDGKFQLICCLCCT